MFAVIELAGHQYKVEPKTKLTVNRLEAKEGETVPVRKVLLYADGEKIDVGQPYLTNVTAKTKILRHFRGEKVRVFKFKPDIRYMRRRGHRQDLTEVEVEAITVK